MKMAMAYLAKRPVMMSAYADGIDANGGTFADPEPFMQMAYGLQGFVPAQGDSL